MEADPGQEKAPQVPQSILRAALIRRAVEDIHRIIQIRTAKQACSTLLQRGSVGDDLWQRFTRAEGEMEAELRDVVMEVRVHFARDTSPRPAAARANQWQANPILMRQANALAPNWGQSIFQNANEIAANGLFQSSLEQIQSKTAAEKEWWEKRRAAISSDFMKELEEEKQAPSDDGVLVDAGTPAEGAASGVSGGKKKKGKK